MDSKVIAVKVLKIPTKSITTSIQSSSLASVSNASPKFIAGIAPPVPAGDLFVRNRPRNCKNTGGPRGFRSSNWSRPRISSNWNMGSAPRYFRDDPEYSSIQKPRCRESVNQITEGTEGRNPERRRFKGSMAPSLTFDQSAAEFVLESFGRETDEDGFIIDPSDGKRELTPEGEEIHIDDFSGVENGSELFLDDDFKTLVEHVKRRQ